MPKSQGKVTKKCRLCNHNFMYCFYSNNTFYCSDKCRLTNAKKIKRGKGKEYADRNKHKKKIYDEIYYLKNSEKIKERAKLHRQNNKGRRWEREKIILKENPQKYLYKRIQTLLGTYLRKSKTPKYARTFEMLDFDIIDLEEKLKSTIPKGCDWGDFLNGKLHIDHIKPHCLFNYSSCEDSDFKECWSLDNLQLLTAKENITKQGKYEQ